jgi:hypothetical protein
MAEALSQPSCNDDSCSPVITLIPGVPGSDGAAGAAGADGENSSSLLTDSFIVPAEGGTVQVDVSPTGWMVPAEGAIPGQLVAIQFAGYYEIVSVDGAALATVRNLADVANGEYPDNAPPGAVIPTASRVAPAGIQGVAGSTPAGALLSANNLNDVANAATSRTNLGLTSAATTQLGNANGRIPTVDDVAGLTATEAVFATASGLESIAASPARTALGLGTIATQSAAAVAITGGALNGTLGATTPATAQVTTFTASGVSTLAGNVIVSSRLFAPTAGATQSLLAATAINPVGLKIKVVGDGGAVVLIATPTITAPATDGQLLLIQGTDGTNTVTLQDEASLAGTGLELGAATRVLGLGDTILLTWDSTTSKWYEIAFSNN